MLFAFEMLHLVFYAFYCLVTWFLNHPISKEYIFVRATKWKLCYFGHVMRSNGLEKELMTACGEGRRRRGRPRIRWLDEVQEKTGMNLEALREATRERRNWRKYIVTVVRAPRAEDTR